MRARIAAGVLALLLGACGGGGGSDGGGGSHVQVALTSPTNIVEELYEGGPMRTVNLVGTATGGRGARSSAGSSLPRHSCATRLR